MARKKMYYVTGEGKRYPLHEATYDFPITIYKSDCRKAEIGNPEQCLIALGARRNKTVEGAWIGSGKDAYVAFKPVRNKAAHVLHFTINAKAARIRDFFETHKGVTTQQITLSAVTAGRTRAHRAKLNALRAKNIKNGKHIVKPRTKPSTTRIMRLGVAHRPRATIENNVVAITPREEAA
jgi:hypothetical protein